MGRPITTRSDYIPPTGYFWARQDIWNSEAANLVNGKDYDQMITYYPGLFPCRTSVVWDWRSAATNGSPWGYPGLAWANQQPGLPPPPTKQIQDFSQLSTAINYSFTGSVANQDILHEMWLYPQSSFVQGVGPGPIFEVELLLVPKSGPWPTQFYIFSIADPFSADVFLQPNSQPPSILIYPTKNLVGTITVDWLKIYSQLIANGVLTGHEWAYGFELGVEVWQGRGSLNINCFAVNWQ